MDETDRLAPFNPTCEQAQAKAIDLLSLSSDDVLFDLGCGDGRLLITAAQQIEGLKCIGVDMDATYIQRAIKSVGLLPSGVRKRIHIRQENLIEKGLQENIVTATSIGDESNGGSCRNLSLEEDATAIYMFLLPKGLARIKPLLDSLVERRRAQQKRLKVVTYMFCVHGWEPLRVDDSTKGNVRLYLYVFGV